MTRLAVLRSIMRIFPTGCAAICTSFASASTIPLRDDPPAITELDAIRAELMRQTNENQPIVLFDKRNFRLAQWWRNWGNYWRNF
jgi:hypothetical protein